jgi:lipopolysaccharide transport system ATP-binding protein
MSCDMKSVMSEIPPTEALDSSVAVRVDHVSKAYSMWSSPKARLMRPILHMAQRMLPLSQSRIERLQQHMAAMHKDFYALRDVSFEIRKGESWGFVGVNGSGKSTLLKIISGNLLPTTGSVEVDGKVAILDYGSGFNGEFTGRENVYLKASMHGLTRREVERRFSSIEAFAEIGEFIDQPVKTYSSGMQARLGFAVMAHVDADIMITDEALAVGDAFFVQKCMAHIRSFLKKGTFLFVSHAVNDVVSLCQNAVWLEHGQIRKIGSAKDVTEAYIASASLKASKRFLEEEQPEQKTISTHIGAALQANGQSAIASSARLTQPKLSRQANSHVPRITRDPRLEFLNRSPWRNDIKLPEFSVHTESFGIGGAHIEDVCFEDESGAPLSWIIGAELVRLSIDVRASEHMMSPIVGFQVKDRLGQVLFADNTYLATIEQPLKVPSGCCFRAIFRFQMPLLPVGDYVLRVAVARGSEDNHAMMHSIENALVFRSVTSGTRHGLVGVPMQEIELFVLEN